MATILGWAFFAMGITAGAALIFFSIAIVVYTFKDKHEPKRGRWIENDSGWGDIYYCCSVCDAAICTIEGDIADQMWNYCPECGARMDGIVRIPEPEEEDDDN